MSSNFNVTPLQQIFVTKKLGNLFVGMGENNAARNRTLHLSRDTQLAAAAIYQQLYGIKSPDTTDIKVPATFQVIFIFHFRLEKSQY